MALVPSFGLIVLGALALLLVSAGIEDIRHREIANWKNAAVALLAPLWWWSSGVPLWPDLAIQMGLATGVFALFVLAFALGMMGGGDVKLIGALALWLPFQALATMLIVMSLAGGLVTVAAAISHRRRGNPGQIQVPYGVAIAIAGLFSMYEPILNQISQCLAT